jgi:hypothetical protein
MVLAPEIKNFIKNTLILTIFFTLILHLSWWYIGPMFGIETSASRSNSKRFSEQVIPYLWSVTTALSLSLGQREKQIWGAPISLSNSLISVSSVLANPKEWEKRLIWGNMSFINTYDTLLSTDIVGLLDRSDDRTDALDGHINILEDYGQDVTEKILSLEEQINELSAIITEQNGKSNNAKAVLENSYKTLDYTGVDSSIESYIRASTSDTRARIYKNYLERFRKTYISLQAKNKKITETLRTNREALIKRSTVIIPNSGTDLLKELKLIQSLSEYEPQKQSE